jgi:LDH2 family malate/lactate/ureidoglycolate dehydrogenase
MRFGFDTLVRFAQDALAAAGLDEEKAKTVAHHLVSADAMGHATHGLALLPDYVEELKSGAMAARGEPGIVSDRGAALVWDGKRLPGIWLTARAVDLAIERASKQGVCAIAIRASHHIGCLATFLPAATDKGLMAIVASSDPSDAIVAPHGGRGAVLTPDPLAVGIPTAGDPILIDISASITTAGMSARLRKEGRRFPGAWAIDASGRATDEPSVLIAEPKGALLPVGGLEYGHKGFALALAVEALTQGLSGFGRADTGHGWGASVFVQVMDPEAFGGLTDFVRQTTRIAELCRASPPIDAEVPVRMPGANALVGLARAKREGVELHPSVRDGLMMFAKDTGLAMPAVVAVK